VRAGSGSKRSSQRASATYSGTGITATIIPSANGVPPSSEAIIARLMSPHATAPHVRMRWGCAAGGSYARKGSIGGVYFRGP